MLMNYNDQLRTLKENLELLSARKEINFEQQLLTFQAIAKIICENDQYSDIHEICDTYRAFIRNTTAVSEKALYTAILATPRLEEELFALLSVGSIEAAVNKESTKIAYVKNKFNDIAYEKLSKAFQKPRAVLVDSPREACEAVANGIVENCILPIENSRDGKLFGFYEMLDRFDLKICAVCSIDTEDDFGYIKHALIARGCKALLHCDLENKSYIFEFSTLAMNADFLGELIDFAKLCGAVSLTIDSKPTQYDPQLKRYTLSFLISGSYQFLMYPPLVLAGYSPIGFYPNEF